MARIKAYDLINVSDIGRNDAFLIETDGGTKTVNAYDLISDNMKYVVLTGNKSLNDVSDPGVIYRDNSGAFLRYGICLVDSTGKPNMQFAIRSDGSIKYRSWKNTGWDVAWTDTSQNIPVERIQQAVENYLREHPIASGKSAYEIALEEGYQGTKAEWLTSLKGLKGKSITDANVDKYGILSVTFEEEKEINGEIMIERTYKSLGFVKGSTGDRGDKGESIVDANIDADGNLILTHEIYAGDHTAVGFINAGHVVGPDGAPGEPGAPGADYVLTEEDKHQISELVTNEIVVRADTLADCVEPDVIYIVDNDEHSNLPTGATPPYKVSCVSEFNGDVVRQYIFDNSGHIYTRIGILDGTFLNPVYSATRIATTKDIPTKISSLENDSGFITHSRIAKLESQFRISDSYSMDLTGVPITILNSHPTIDVGDFGQEDSSDNANVYYIYISADVTRIKQGALMTTPHNLPSLVCVYIDRDVTEVEQSIEPGAPVTEGMLGIETGAISSRVYIYYKGNFHIFDELVSAIRNVDRRLTAAIIDKDVDRLGEKVKFIETSDPDTAVENGIWYRVHTDSEDYALFAVSTDAKQTQFQINSAGSIAIRQRETQVGNPFPAWGEFEEIDKAIGDKLDGVPFDLTFTVNDVINNYVVVEDGKLLWNESWCSTDYCYVPLENGGTIEITSSILGGGGLAFYDYNKTCLRYITGNNASEYDYTPASMPQTRVFVVPKNTSYIRICAHKQPSSDMSRVSLLRIRKGIGLNQVVDKLKSLNDDVVAGAIATEDIRTKQNILFNGLNVSFTESIVTPVYLKSGESVRITVTDKTAGNIFAYIDGHSSASITISKDGVYIFTASFDGYFALYTPLNPAPAANMLIEYISALSEKLSDVESETKDNTAAIGSVNSTIYKTVNLAVEQGDIDTGNNGGNVNSEKSVRTPSFIEKCINISFPETHVARIFAYQGSTFVGCWSGTEFNKDWSKNLYMPSPVNMGEFFARFPDYSFRLTFMAASKTPITPADTPVNAQIEKYADKIPVYTVGAGGDFATFNGALIALANDSSEKIIEVKQGIYNIFEEYGGAEYIASLTDVDSLSWEDVSVIVPPNTIIRGIGNVVLEWNPTDSEIIDQKHAFLHSPLNLCGSCTIENIKIVCSNCRYGIHDECSGLAVFNEIVRKLKNVVVIYNASTYGVKYAYGAGHARRGSYRYENCTFSAHYGDVWSTHNYLSADTLTHATIEFVFCKFINNITNRPGNIRLSSTNANARKDSVYLNGCYANGISYGSEWSSTDVWQNYSVTSMCSSPLTDTYQGGNLIEAYREPTTQYLTING